MEKILTPLSWLYRVGYEIHQHSVTPEKIDCPVICIGNVNVGGTGKTPTALALMDLIRRHNLAKNPFFLLRGYGGGERGPLLVDLQKHNSWSTGDEALILAALAPTIVAADRAQGGHMAARKNADLILMDDGLQNPGIQKDIKILVINGEMGFGNGKMLPAGPLREPLAKGLARADLYILIGEDTRNIIASLPPGHLLVRARLEPDEKNLPLGGKKYLAFAGLGYPEKFFNFLEEHTELDIVKTISFPDHYPYNEHDLRNLSERAREWDAGLITTPKDRLRLPVIPEIEVHTADIKLVWEDEGGLVDLLRTRLRSAS
jgi:tetraacyldisaccharide 4'-kinase